MKDKGKTKSSKQPLDADFLSDIGNLCQGIQDFGKSAVPVYKEFAYDVIHERITDIDQIEYQLDFMLSFCFDSEILQLYKSVLRKLLIKHPDSVQFYVEQYFEMFGTETE